MSRPKILCISLSPLHRDGRVLRQISVLQQHGDVTTVGFGPAPAGVAEHIQVPDSKTLPQTPSGVAKLALHRFKAVELGAPAVRAAIELIGDREFDLVVANENRSIPLGFAVKKNAPIWADLHEWGPGERDQVLVWKLLVKPLIQYIGDTYLARCDALTTTSDGFADEYEKAYGVRPELVRNARPFVDLQPTPLAEDGTIRLVHSGAADANRRIDLLVQAVLDTTGTTLDLYLVPAGDGGKHLAQVQAMADKSDRITIHPPTTPADLPAALNAYDMGVFYLDPVNVNMEQTLPNKLFDFVQARLGTVVTPNPGMKRFVLENEVGLAAPDYTVAGFVKTLADLTPEVVWAYKQAAHQRAQSLSNESDLATSNAIIERLLAR